MSGINRWLTSKISKYSDYNNKEYLDNVYSLLIDFIDKNENLVEKFYRKDMLKYFYIFIFNKNYFERESCDLIDMHFNSNIVDFYFEIKERYGLELLEEKNINVDDILIFLNHMTYFYEDDYGNEEEDLITVEEILM